MEEINKLTNAATWFDRGKWTITDLLTLQEAHRRIVSLRHSIGVKLGEAKAALTKAELSKKVIRYRLEREAIGSGMSSTAAVQYANRHPETNKAREDEADARAVVDLLSYPFQTASDLIVSMSQLLKSLENDYRYNQKNEK